MRKGSLCVVGTGIHLNHLTIESKDQIEDADKVFFLAADPTTATWIMRANSSAESLQDCYSPGMDRLTSYRQMATRIIHSVQSGLRVCAVFYGHPGFLVTPAHKALKQATEEGFECRMLPAVSALDCLFADLGVEPGSGCQIFEATDFLVRSRIFDPTCSLVLFQIGIIGDPTCNPGKSEHPGLKVLVDYLLRFYEPSHPVVLYEAAQMPTGKPSIIHCQLADVVTSLHNLIATLYVYPAPQRDKNEEMIAALI